MICNALFDVYITIIIISDVETNSSSVRNLLDDAHIELPAAANGPSQDPTDDTEVDASSFQDSDGPSCGTVALPGSGPKVYTTAYQV